MSECQYHLVNLESFTWEKDLLSVIRKDETLEVFLVRTDSLVEDLMQREEVEYEVLSSLDPDINTIVQSSNWYERMTSCIGTPLFVLSNEILSTLCSLVILEGMYVGLGMGDNYTQLAISRLNQMSQGINEIEVPHDLPIKKKIDYILDSIELDKEIIPQALKREFPGWRPSGIELCKGYLSMSLTRVQGSKFMGRITSEGKYLFITSTCDSYKDALEELKHSGY